MQYAQAPDRYLSDLPYDNIVYSIVDIEETFDEKSLEQLPCLLMISNVIQINSGCERKGYKAKTELRAISSQLENAGHGDEGQLQQFIDQWKAKSKKIQKCLAKEECAASLAKKAVELENAKKALETCEKEMKDFQKKMDEIEINI